jgi:Zn-finger nucleic acid-binding protein
MEAGTLNCPHCGAAVKQDSLQCAYCQALLQTVACPKCMAMMFAGSEYCPKCGARTEAATPQGPTAHDCPRCQVQGRKLEHVRLGDALVEECRQCGGMWVDAGRFERLCSDTEAQSQGSGTPDGGAGPIPHIAPEAKIRYIHCPVCDQIMNRVNFGLASGVVIDVCKGHGIWLDKNELQEIIAFIHAGGMKQTHEMESQRLQSERLQMISRRDINISGMDYSASSSVGQNDGTDLVGAILSVAWDLMFKR